MILKMLRRRPDADTNAPDKTIHAGRSDLGERYPFVQSELVAQEYDQQGKEQREIRASPITPFHNYGLAFL